MKALLLLFITSVTLSAQVPSALVMIKGVQNGDVDSLLRAEKQAYLATDVYSEATRNNYYLWPLTDNGDKVDTITANSCLYISRVRNGNALVYQTLTKSKRNAMVTDFNQNQAFVLNRAPNQTEIVYKSAIWPGLVLYVDQDLFEGSYTIYSLRLSVDNIKE